MKHMKTVIVYEVLEGKFTSVKVVTLSLFFSFFDNYNKF